MLVRSALRQAQPKVHEIFRTAVCFQMYFFSSFTIDCGLYIETIQHEIEESIGFVISFHYINNLIFSIQIVFPSLNRFESWLNWERKRGLIITVEYL